MAYQHKEAFALMWYACACGHRERFWNSRDGVTPFGGIQCPSCGEQGMSMTGGLSHIRFDLDECVPESQAVSWSAYLARRHECRKPSRS
jgi:hypothetical protein